jgi:hypothetical protein
MIPEYAEQIPPFPGTQAQRGDTAGRRRVEREPDLALHLGQPAVECRAGLVVPLLPGLPVHGGTLAGTTDTSLDVKVG